MKAGEDHRILQFLDRNRALKLLLRKRRRPHAGYTYDSSSSALASFKSAVSNPSVNP